jgi:dienelactone hydrolase
VPQEIIDEAPDKAARADAWPKVIAFIQQLRTAQ